MCLDNQLCVLGGLVRRRDTSEVLDLASTCLLVQTLGVALLRNLNGNINIDLDKRKRLVVALGALFVELAGDEAVCPVRANEGSDGDGGRVGKELGDLCDAANVLVAVLFGKAQVLVQAEADIVAVEAVGGEAQVQKVLLEGGGDGGFSRGGQAGEPDGEALLLTVGFALGAREGRVPGDVAGLVVGANVSFIFGSGGDDDSGVAG